MGKVHRLTHVTKPSDVINGPHFAIMMFEQQSVYIEGDERSRTNPGHGYPARTETYDTNSLWITTKEQDWVDAINELYTIKPNRTDVLAYRVAGVAQIKMETVIKIGV